jgi:hypothetical protein
MQISAGQGASHPRSLIPFAGGSNSTSADASLVASPHSSRRVHGELVAPIGYSPIVPSW